MEELKISKEVLKLSKEADEKLKNIYEDLENIALVNSAKVLNAFKNNKVSTVHLGYTTGYGYDDVGRDVIEKVYSDVFKAQDALVRIQFVNGTHAISNVFFANLKTSDELVYITGMPYDTLHTSIGITKEVNQQSLIATGVKFNVIDLLNESDFDVDKITKYLKENKVKMIAIQRSKGYAFRKTISINDIENIVKKIRAIDKDVIIMIDNCYGEFTEEREPIEVGADVCVGSLIKNIGGGLCNTGAYIVGRKDIITNCSQRLTCPGIGKECGATLDQNRNMLQGLFIAPNVVKDTLKAMIFSAYILEKLDFECMPKYSEIRSDIVQTIKFGNAKNMIKFIQGIQYASPIDSFVTAVPWEMPGYEDKVIMAAGNFVQGASIELSADSPIREPYVAYMQGGITFPSAKLAIMIAVSNMLK